MTAELEHFLRLARRGFAGTGASGGEIRAAAIARVLIEELPGLDRPAIHGATELMILAVTDPQLARDLLDSS